MYGNGPDEQTERPIMFHCRWCKELFTAQPQTGICTKCRRGLVVRGPAYTEEEMTLIGMGLLKEEEDQ